MTTATDISSTGLYRVLKGGPRCWYVQLVADGSLYGLPFTTKKAAAAACARRNLPVWMKQLPQAQQDAILAGDIDAAADAARATFRVVR